MMLKTCNKCKEEKSVEYFSPLKTGKNGLNPVCKLCRSEKARAERIENPEQVREKERARHSRNPSIKKKSIKKWYAANADKKKDKERLRYVENTEKIKLRAKSYRENNKGKVREWNGTRRAIMKTAMPVWANRKAIAEFYKEAHRLWTETGIEHHVDHIIPLISPIVSGLHVESNLQILQKQENLKKSNRLIQECPH